MNTYEVRRYRTASGKVILTDWLRRLRDTKGRIAIDMRISRMEDGNFGDHKSCSGGVWELRINIGPGYRVYYGLDGQQLVLLLCGGDKATQDADIARAREYWRDWQKRKEL
jgi:putative addiction module killer protein